MYWYEYDHFFFIACLIEAHKQAQDKRKPRIPTNLHLNLNRPVTRPLRSVNRNR